MNWEKVKLGDVIEPPLSGEWGEEGIGVSVLRTTNFTNEGKLDLEEVVTRKISKQKVDRKKLIFGDTILEKSGGSPNQPVGRVVYFDIQSKEKTYLCNNFTSVLRPKTGIDSKYLFWFLFNNHVTKKTLRYQNKTTGIINLQTERYLNELQIPLPPLPIQEKIADLLDKADELRKKDKQLLAKYDELLQSIFYDMFRDYLTNGDRSLSELVKLNPKKSEISVSDDFKVSFIPMASVGERGEIETSEIKEFSAVRTGFTYFRENDVLFAKITPCMENGKGAIARNLKNGIGFGSTEFHVLRPNQKINAEFIYFLLAQKETRVTASKNMTGSAGQKRVPVDFFRKIKIKIPPISLQNQFANIAKNIELQKQQVRQQMAHSEDLFQSLLQRAFNQQLHFE